MKKRYWLGIAISVILVIVLFRSIEIASVATAFQHADLVFLVPAIILYFVGIVPRALRWGILIAPVRKIGFGRLYRVLVVGFMANDVLPLRAGEAVRAFMLWQKERVSPGATVATILVERILDGLVLTGFLVVGSATIRLDDSLTWLIRVAGVVFAVAVVGVVGLAIAPRITLRLAELSLRPFPSRLGDLAMRLIRGFEDGLKVLRSPGATALVLLLSVLAWVLEAGMYYTLMYSFSFAPSFSAAVLGAAVANLASMIPSSPGYVGTFDVGLLRVLVDTFRVDASQAAAYTGLVHAALILPVVVLGLVFVWRDGLSLRRLASRESLTDLRSTDTTEARKAAAPRSLP